MSTLPPLGVDSFPLTVQVEKIMLEEEHSTLKGHKGHWSVT